MAAFSRDLTETLEPFLLNLIRHGLADKILARRCDNFEMLGGEIVRRRHYEPDLTEQPVSDLLLNLVEEERGRLIWPCVTATTQREFDASCRKLYRFLQRNNPRNYLKSHLKIPLTLIWTAA